MLGCVHVIMILAENDPCTYPGSYVWLPERGTRPACTTPLQPRVDRLIYIALDSHSSQIRAGVDLPSGPRALTRDAKYN